MFRHEQSRDPAFRTRTQDSTYSVGLLYDLDHHGRGLQDFPQVMQLTVPTPRQEQVRWWSSLPPLLISDVRFGQPYEQIISAIEQYAVGRRSDSPEMSATAFQKWIDPLRELAERCRDKTVTITFEACWKNDGDYIITRLACGEIVSGQTV